MQEKLELRLFIEHGRQGTYFTLPFTMPPDVESMVLRYSYDRHLERELPVERGTFVAREEVNIIDLGLLSPDGRQVGASGSDKREIFISETDATPGYNPCPSFQDAGRSSSAPTRSPPAESTSPTRSPLP